MIGREAIADTIRSGSELTANELVALFEAMSPTERTKAIELISGERPVTTEEPARPKTDIAGYAICAELVREMHGKLIAARIEGRWEAVVEHFYHAHYTRAYLRRTGAIPHYLGEGVVQPDPQIYS